MGEVFAAGLTHYPPLMGPDRDMSWVLKWTLDDPDIPAHLRDAAAWPQAMQDEWGDDEGTAAAATHRASLVEGFQKIRARLDEFAPDVVVIWGDDQYENFKEDLIPPFSILAYDDVVATPWKAINRANVWNESPDAAFRVRGARDFGLELASGLLERDIDVAYAYAQLHHPTLAHSFLNAVLLLDYDRTGFPYPVLPVAVNCYGSRIISFKGGRSRLADRALPKDPPGPAPRRCMAVGAAMAEVALASDKRVAFLASSSWSHAFLTDHTFRLYPDIPADRALYDALITGSYGEMRARTTGQIETAGQQEVLNWFCLAGAAERLGVLPDWSTLVETHAFNSNKVFVTYPIAGR